MTTRPHTGQELALHRVGFKSLRKIATFHNEIEIVNHIIENDGSGEAHGALEEALEKSIVYTKWQKLMPFLKMVPSIYAYRNKSKHKFDIRLVDLEILRFGGYLPKGQILYHGGTLLAKDTISSDGPISTSMMPSVARYHAKKVSGDLALFEVAEDNVLRAFAFKTKGNQKLKHEYEVLLQNNIRLEYKKTSVHCDMKIHEFKIFQHS